MMTMNDIGDKWIRFHPMHMSKEQGFGLGRRTSAQILKPPDVVSHGPEFTGQLP